MAYKYTQVFTKYELLTRRLKKIFFFINYKLFEFCPKIALKSNNLPTSGSNKDSNYPELVGFNFILMLPDA